MVIKMSACSSTAGVLATFSVPGIFRSSVWPVNRNSAVCGAKQPMPSTSKKFVTKPITAVESQRPAVRSCRWRRRSRASTATNHVASSAIETQMKAIIFSRP